MPESPPATRFEPRPLPADWRPASDLHPVLARVLASRGLADPDALKFPVSALPSFETLKDIEPAAGRIVQAIVNQQSILIVGDFDADGATSSALGLLGLTALGAERVGFLVPNRFEYGYGLTPKIVAEARTRSPHLIITVDNGISSVDGVAAANAAGIDVIVTDHHLAGAELPEAVAIVNPNQPGDLFPCKALAGVGVMFYVLLAVRSALKELGWFSDAPPNLAEFLDLVALGTVADVVPLDPVNRIMVAQGIRRIRAGRCRPGIRALLGVDGRAPESVCSRDLGFSVAPRLNAAGRLTDMTLGIECLATADAGRAAVLARELDALNAERKSLEAGMREQAFGIADGLLANGIDGDAGLTLYDAGWHEGLVGLVAARVKDRFGLPTVAFAPSSDPAVLKGSARSVDGLHIRDLIETIATEHPGLIARYGGHAMAAGLSLPATHLEAFEAAYDAHSRAQLARIGAGGAIPTDGELPAAELSVALARLLKAAAPWGRDFPEPMFEGAFAIRDRRIVGSSHVKLKLDAGTGAAPVDAIAFGRDYDPLLRAGASVRAAYRLDVNSWRARDSLQLIVEHVLPD